MTAILRLPTIPDAAESGVRPSGRLPADLRVRADCLDGGAYSARPCPFRSCRHHLAAARSSCSLDAADERPRTLDEVGRLLGGLSRERVRQIETAALAALRKRTHAAGLERSDLGMFVEAAPDDTHSITPRR